MILEKTNVLKNGDILHCSRNSFMSKAIRFLTRSKKISHTALVMELEGGLFIADSQMDGTRLRPLKQWLRKFNYDVIITRTIPISSPLLLSKVSYYLNVRYDFFGMVRHAIYNITGIWITGKRPDKYFICSEFVARIIGKDEADKTNPLQLYIYCLEKGHKVIHQK